MSKEIRKKEVPRKEQKTQTIEEKKRLASQTKQLLQEYRNRRRTEESIVPVISEPLSGAGFISPMGEISQFELKDFSNEAEGFEGVDEDQIEKPMEQVYEIPQDMPEGVQEMVASPEEKAPPVGGPTGLSTQHEAAVQMDHGISLKPNPAGQEGVREIVSDETTIAEPSYDYENPSSSVLEPIGGDTASITDVEVETEQRSYDLGKAGPSDVTSVERDGLPQGLGPSLNDERVADQIAAFEASLTMACPICSIGRVKTEQTAKNKIFYKCTNEECIFMSWGKPYHLGCPLCNNPFLVEVMEGPETVTLKCPRATCSHRQKIPDGITNGYQESAAATAQQGSKAKLSSPKERRKVVRKMLVRRRKM